MFTVTGTINHLPGNTQYLSLYSGVLKCYVGDVRHGRLPGRVGILPVNTETEEMGH